MKKIFLGILLLSSALLSNENNWKNELSIHRGLMNSFSINTNIYLCEHKNKDRLIKNMIEFMEKQDPVYYKKHKKRIDLIPELLIKSTKKESAKCPKGYTVEGSCGYWMCEKEIKHVFN